MHLSKSKRFSFIDWILSHNKDNKKYIKVKNDYVRNNGSVMINLSMEV